MVKNNFKKITNCPGNTGIATVLPRYFPRYFGDFGDPGISKLATGHPEKCMPETRCSKLVCPSVRQSVGWSFGWFI